ncbi:MAG: S24 family peptidase [Rhodospirillaceae bacterium]
MGHHGEPTLLVPVYGPVACGEPFMWSSGEAIGYERLSAEDAKLIDVVIVVAGDSLSAERINDGDRLGVQRLNGEQPPDGAIVVVEAEGSYMAKVYRRNAVGEYLESRRLGRDPEPLLLGDEVRLVGRARKHIRNL